MIPVGWRLNHFEYPILQLNRFLGHKNEAPAGSIVQLRAERPTCALDRRLHTAAGTGAVERDSTAIADTITLLPMQVITLSWPLTLRIIGAELVTVSRDLYEFVLRASRAFLFLNLLFFLNFFLYLFLYFFLYLLLYHMAFGFTIRWWWQDNRWLNDVDRIIDKFLVFFHNKFAVLRWLDILLIVLLVIGWLLCLLLLLNNYFRLWCFLYTLIWVEFDWHFFWPFIFIRGSKFR